jgi:large subunit ribosomal protein L22
MVKTKIDKLQKMNTIAKAYARYIRVSPRKTRQIINLIRGQSLTYAFALLASINKGAKIYVEKVLKSAASNAKQNPAVNPEELFISKISADNGPMLKRYRAAAMGRATMIRHRTTHLCVELAQPIVKQTKKEKKKTVKVKARR